MKCKIRLHQISFAFHCVYGCSTERRENGDGEDGNEMSGDYLASCRQMTWLYVVN